jgi:8-oxo-dGTP pyrophosphatase MutT (NUDIX family)
MSGEPIASPDQDPKTQLAEALAEARANGPKLTPRAAATLIMIDRSGTEPKVLLGKRHDNHKFMPGKFVFPGGRIEANDFLMPAVNELSAATTDKLGKHVGTKVIKPRSLALAAVRETFEETGIILGKKTEPPAGGVVPKHWAAFVAHGYLPDLSQLQFIGRAITPPGRPKRFDSRFFSVDASHIAHQIEGVVTPHSELVELVWCPIAEAAKLGIPVITAIILEELGKRTEAGFAQELPVPMFFQKNRKFVREEL